jgi:hypothetical protein
LALGTVVVICSCLIRAAAMLRNMAVRWLDVRCSLRPASDGACVSSLRSFRTRMEEPHQGKTLSGTAGSPDQAGYGGTRPCPCVAHPE